MSVVREVFDNNKTLSRERQIRDSYFSYVVSIADNKKYVNIYAYDITARKEEEEAKKQEKEKAEMYLNVAAVTILALDRNQNVSLINKRTYAAICFLRKQAYLRFGSGGVSWNW